MSVLVSWVRGGLLTGQDKEADEHHRWGYSQVPTGFGALCTWSPHIVWLWCQCWFPEWGEGYWGDRTWRLTNTTGGDMARSLQGLVLCVPGLHILCGCDVSAGFLSEGRATDGTGHRGWPGQLRGGVGVFPMYFSMLLICISVKDLWIFHNILNLCPILDLISLMMRNNGTNLLMTIYLFFPFKNR